MSAALLRKMADMGLTMEQAIDLIETFEASHAPAPKVRSNNAERQARYRAKRAETVISGVTSNAESNVTDEPLSPKPPIPEPTPFTPLKGGVSPALSTQPPCRALLEQLWQISPQRAKRRSSKALAGRAVTAAIRRGADPAELLAGVRAYYASDDAQQENAQFAKGLHSLISTGMWEAFTEPDEGAGPAAWGDDEWRMALEILAETGRWGDTCGPRPGEPGCRVPSNLLIGAVA